MKRLLLLVLVTATVFAGCGEDAGDSPTARERSNAVTTVPEEEANVTILFLNETEGSALPVVVVDGQTLLLDEAELRPGDGGSPHAEPGPTASYNLRLEPGPHEIRSTLNGNPPDVLSFEVGEARIWIGVIFWGERDDQDSPITSLDPSDVPIGFA